eukprot:TRINITY_DN67358_c0_g1_i1.p1 TRINITY_DN67358_c0_g1~~TRINITY_DN67358_c0_g1_i1.p1  ORF type:complete len:223 (-),score=29.76 TRINITY_DN67358_c0_g1_i1:329-997(-)
MKATVVAFFLGQRGWGSGNRIDGPMHEIFPQNAVVNDSSWSDYEYWSAELIRPQLSDREADGMSFVDEEAERTTQIPGEYAMLYTGRTVVPARRRRKRGEPEPAERARKLPPSAAQPKTTSGSGEYMLVDDVYGMPWSSSSFPGSFPVPFAIRKEDLADYDTPSETGLYDNIEPSANTVDSVVDRIADVLEELPMSSRQTKRARQSRCEGRRDGSVVGEGGC